MSEWKQEDVVFPAPGRQFGKYAQEATLQIEVTSGSVECQFQDSTGTWVAAADMVFSESGIQKISVVNTPAMRVHVTGDAKYRFTYN